MQTKKAALIFFAVIISLQPGCGKKEKALPDVSLPAAVSEEAALPVLSQNQVAPNPFASAKSEEPAFEPASEDLNQEPSEPDLLAPEVPAGD